VPLAPGHRLGPYEIVSPLGRGGMGEVYKARDGRLDRTVAIKVLPAHLSENPETQRRFEWEARAIAGLSHPAICTLHDVGHEEGIDFLVLEYLEGETLADRVERGPLPPGEVVRIGVPVAEALHQAHRSGVVHRDLKPENVFLTRAGRVKVFDFGLAKRDRTLAGEATSPGHTTPGMVVGTIGYMSPEQVRGDVVDHRSDVFSLGLVLHEMLTGTRAFRGRNGPEVMASILRDAAPPLPDVDPALARIVEHCLEKAPEDRFQSAQDVAFALGALAASSGSAGRPAAPTLRSARPLRLDRRWIWRGAATVALLALGAAGAIALWPRRPEPPAFRRLSFRRGTIGTARFAPDGRTVVYDARWEGRESEVFSVRVESPEYRPLGLKSAQLRAVSSAGELALQLRPRLWFGFHQGTLAQVPLGGGEPRELLENVQEADWTPDGAGLAVLRVTGDARWLIERPPGKAVYETDKRTAGMRLSARTGQIAFLESFEYFQRRKLEVGVVDADGRKRVLLKVPGATGLAWGPTGREVWVSADDPDGGSSVSAVDLEGRRRLLYRSAGSLRLVDVALDGRILVTLDDVQVGMSGRAAGGSRDVDLSWLDGSVATDLAPDGSRVLFNETGAGGGARGAFYLRGLDGSPAVRLGEGAAQSLSPDGSSVLIQPPGEPTTLAIVPIGAGPTRRVPLAGISDVVEGYWFFPDGKRVLFAGRAPGQPFRLFAVDVEGGAPRAVTPEGVLNFGGETPLSPDGRWVSANGGPIGKRFERIYPVEGGEPRELPGFTPGDAVIRWSADGRSVYAYRRDELPAALVRIDVGTGARETLREIVPPDPAGVATITWMKMTPDARSYVYNYTRRLSTLYLVEGLR